MTYCQILKELREDLELTQEQVAKDMNINRVQYNQYENDYNTAPTKYLYKFCQYYNVSVDYLFGFVNACRYENARNEIDIKLVAERLKEVRKSLNLTQDDVAKLVNTNRSVIANYERGRSLIPTAFLYVFCRKYRISADYILGRIDSPKKFYDLR